MEPSRRQPISNPCLHVWWLGLALGIIVGFSPAWAAVPVPLWSMGIGGSSVDVGYSVTHDGNGDVLVTGSFNGVVDFGGGPLVSAGGDDIFLAKYDAAGNHLWSRQIGGIRQDVALSVATDGAGNILLTGFFGGAVDFGGGGLTSAGLDDIFVAKYDPGGNHVWSRRIGSFSLDEGLGIAVDVYDNVIVTGFFSGLVDFGGGPMVSSGGFDAFVAKYDPNNVHLWSRRGGGFSGDRGSAVVSDAFGNVVVAGTYAGPANFGGATLANAGFDDVFVAMYDAGGTHLWSLGAGGPESDQAWSLGIDGAFNAVVSGSFRGSVDFGGGPLVSAGSDDIFIAAYGPAGNHAWSRSAGGPGSDQARAVAIDRYGDTVVAGFFSGTVDLGGGPLTSAGGNDVFIATYDTSGNHSWSNRFGGAGSEFLFSADSDAAGSIAAAGFYVGTADLGGGPLANAGIIDAFVAAYFDHILAELDIRPGSCPNMYNVKLSTFGGESLVPGGNIKVAVLGTPDLDVNDIDVSTLSLIGVAPLIDGGATYGDVSTPVADNSNCACTTLGADGFDDVTVRFGVIELSEAMMPIDPSETFRSLMLRGRLFDGTPFEASDCVQFTQGKRRRIIVPEF